MKQLQKMVLLIIVLMCFSSCNTNSNLPKPETSYGSSSVLKLTTVENPEYDGTFGKTKITLTLSENKRVINKTVLEGIWQCVGYIKKDRRYMLLGRFQVGAWQPAIKIKYISEDKFELSDSRYQYDYKAYKGWVGLSAVPNEELKYVVFIGNLDGGKTVLMVLNTQTDRIKVLGDPPAPPPETNVYWQKERIRMSPDSWDWGIPCVDGYTEMDEGIITFKNEILSVTYGNDSVIKRSDKRTIKRWDLKDVFKD